MKFLLDTDICILLIRKKSGKVLNRLARQKVGDIGISSVTLAELAYGVAKSSDPERNRQALNDFVAPMEVAAFDEGAAHAYGVVRADLERRGVPIGSMDMLIGAHAASLDVILVTANAKEFRRIRGLSVDDWTA